MQADLVVVDAKALNLWPAHDPITPVPSPVHDAASCARSRAGTFVAKSAPMTRNCVSFDAVKRWNELRGGVIQ
jgi:hypothetical protein